MAISYVKLVTSVEPHAPGATYAMAITNAPAAGNLLVLVNGGGSASILTSVTDSKGNTWTVNKTAANVNSSGNYTSIASTTQNAGTLTATDTVTLHFTSSVSGYVPILCHEFSGCTNTVDQTASFGTATATTARDGGTTAATTNANDLVVSGFSILGNETSLTAGTGYTVPASGAFVGNASASVEFEYQIVSATGTYHPTATGGKSLANGGATVIYKGAAGGGAIANTLTASPGAMTITGDAITPPIAHKPTASPGAMTITGSATTTPVKHAPTLNPGTMALSGHAALLPVARTTTLSPGTVVITGDATTLVVSHIFVLSASPGVMSITGSAALFPVKRGLVTAAGTYTITGDLVTFTTSTGKPALNPTPGPYKTGADMHGFNPFPGTARIPGSACFTGPIAQWVPYHDVMMIAYDYANQLFQGTRDKSCLQALANAGIGGKV